MDFDLNDDQRLIQRTARELLARYAAPERVREHAEAQRTDDALWGELSGLGWPGVAVAEEYGGQGLGAIELAILCEELGRTVAPVPFLPTVLAATLIEHAGSDAQRKHLHGLASGEVKGAVGQAVDGRADLVIGGAEADLIVLLEGGIENRTAVLVTREDADVETTASIDPTRSAARIRCDGGEQLPGEVARAIDHALVAVSAELVGVCDRATAMAVDYAKTRKQFGTAIGAYQAISHRCAQMLMDTEQARVATSFAAWAATADPGRLPEAAAMAKAAASEAGRGVTASAIQAHGGIGFTWEADLHWLYKRAQLDAALLGSAGIHRRRLAAIAAADRKPA